MKKIEIVLANTRVCAVLLEDIAPRTCQALWDKLPITALAVNARWSGPAIYLPFELDIDREIENETTFMPPGLIVYNPRHQGFCISYGNAQYREPVGPTYVTAVARIEGDFSPFVAVASKLLIEGAKSITFRRSEENWERGT
jgi:hypothetical protein